MTGRRQFIINALKTLVLVAGALSPLAFNPAQAWAAMKKIVLPKGASRDSLIDQNPAALDTRNLELTPLKEFGTMGLTDHQADLATWRLEVTGLVEKPLKFSYDQLKALPVLERKVLQICPGYFANHGLWKGVSIKELLDKARLEPEVAHISLSGPEGGQEKTSRFPLEDIISGRVFLAYQVNGQILPVKHGWPLRVVAEGYYGYDWIKYVYRVKAEKE